MSKGTLTDLGYETFIYIKEHKSTGLRYFGKTIREDVDRYTGSGKYWLRHIGVHGNYIKTTIVFSSRFKEDLEEFCNTFSKIMDIVKSNMWANLIPENGLDGGAVGTERSEETKHKLSIASTGRKHSNETIAKMKDSRKNISDETKAKISYACSGVRNYRSKPVDIYCSDTGDVIVRDVIVSTWCKENTGYTQCKLAKTATSDRSKPSTATNPHNHKGIYAVYVNK